MSDSSFGRLTERELRRPLGQRMRKSACMPLIMKDLIRAAGGRLSKDALACSLVLEVQLKVAHSKNILKESERSSGRHGVTRPFWSQLR